MKIWIKMGVEKKIITRARKLEKVTSLKGLKLVKKKKKKSWIFFSTIEPPGVLQKFKLNHPGSFLALQNFIFHSCQLHDGLENSNTLVIKIFPKKKRKKES